ncbi:MAG: hypothetical protein NVSMB19_12720 [Vulcanimicrobiaceae bacterium]
MIAAITAGGRADDRFARSLGVAVKALAVVDGTTMLARAIAAARGCGAQRVAVIGGDAVRAACEGDVDTVIPEGRDGRENIRRAIVAGEDQPLLLMTSDLPFVTAEALVDFLRRARAHDVALPLAEARDYVATYPGAPDHITRVGSERIANGSIVYFAPGVAPRALDVSQRLFDARKSLWRMAALLGPALLARFALGRLRIAHVEELGSSLMGLDVRAIRHASPALCFDVDTAEDLAYARAHAARR